MSDSTRTRYLAATARMVIDGHRPHACQAGGDSGSVDGTSSTGERTGEMCRTVAAYQVGAFVCRGCKRGWQVGGGVRVEMSPAAIATAMCDAEEIGAIDGAKPARARQVIPPSVRRMVWLRDGGRCRVTGCRSAWNLDVHHIVPREQGGTNDPDNLILICEGHHLALHEGSLVVAGTMPELVFTRRANNSFTVMTRLVETTEALVTAGFGRREAKAAAEQTRTHVGTEDWSIEAWIKYALAKCSRGSS